MDGKDRADPGAGPGAGAARSVSPAVVVLALALVAAALMAASVPAFPCLEVRDRRSGKLLHLAPVKVGEQFEVNFVHSVEQTPVREVFEVRRDLSIYLVETAYESFGAGLPTEPDEGAKFVVEGGKTRITGLDRRIGELLVGVSPVPGHVLKIREETMVLADLAEPGTGLRITVVREPAVIRIYGGGCKWTRR